MNRAPSPARRARAPRPSGAQRRRELARVAAAQFHGEGYHRVTIGSVAAAVGLTAPAVYRHFANKNALLAAAVETGLEEIESALEPAGPELEDLLRRLAGAALDRPDFWTLLQREMRYLDASEQRRARVRFRAVAATIASAVALRSPDLAPGRRDVLVTSTMAVLAAPSTHHSSLPPDRLAPLLTRAALAACTAITTPAGTADTATPATHEPRGAPDRATQIVDTAIALFHRRGYAAVSLDDIGAAIGIAGPSIYHHYDSKAQLLLLGFDRVLAGLPAVDASPDSSDALRGYIDLALRDREAIGTFVTERISLPRTDVPRIERALVDDLASWTAMLRRERPELDDAEAALLTHAARAAVNDVVRLGHLHRRPSLADELLHVATAVLATPADDPGARAARMR